MDTEKGNRTRNRNQTFQIRVTGTVTVTGAFEKWKPKPQRKPVVVTAAVAPTVALIQMSWLSAY